MVAETTLTSVDGGVSPLEAYFTYTDPAAGVAVAHANAVRQAIDNN